jgi:hypothetical protein
MNTKQKYLITGTMGTWASVVALLIAIPPIIGIKISIGLFVIVASAMAILLVVFFSKGSRTKLYRRSTILIRRTWEDISGSSKRAFITDLVRLCSLIALGGITYRVFTTRPFGLVDEVVFFGSVLGLYGSLVIYPLAKKSRSKWDVEYRLRKLALTAALDAATASVQDSLTNARIRNIEETALFLIKSYLEFTVSDSSGNNFTVNLLVKHPNVDDNLVCIQRSSRSRETPHVYPEKEMIRPKKSLETGEVYYDGNYSNPAKEYKMIWHVPIPSPHFTKAKFIGLLCVDSRKQSHLDLNDDRKALLINLSPYVSLLAYALSLRHRFNKWEPVK